MYICIALKCISNGHNQLVRYFQNNKKKSLGCFDGTYDDGCTLGILDNNI